MDVIPPPLLEFIGFLRQCQHGAGIIKVPSIIKDAITHYIHPLPFIPLRHVSALVAAIDYEGSVICRRMDLYAFAIVYVILNRSEEGLAHQRGLSLLAESLFEPAGSLPEESDSRLGKKIQIGHKHLVTLIRGLGKEDKSLLTKRWMGILALELVKGCDQNKNLLLRESETAWRSLGNAVLQVRCGILKLVAGLTMSEVWPGGAPTTSPWFSDDDLDVYASFPNKENQPSQSQWVVAFESYVDTLASENQATQQRSDMFLAYAASIGDMIYHADRESAILVTVSEDLNVMIPASLAAPAQYVDIPSSQIKDVTMQNVESHSQSDPLTVKSLTLLTVWMSGATDKTFYINAAHHAAASIKIAFTSPKDAIAIKNSLTRLRSHANVDVKIYQSEPIDVSQPLLADDERLENPYEQTILAESMIATASQANETLSYDSMLPDVTESFMQWPRRISQDVGQPPLMNNLISTADDPIEIHHINTGPKSSHQLEDVSGLGVESSIYHRSARVNETAFELSGNNDNLGDEGATLLKSRSPLQNSSARKSPDNDNLNSITPLAEDQNQTQKQQTEPVLCRRTNVQEPATNLLLPSINAATNNSHHHHAKISERMRKDDGRPAIESLAAAKPVVGRPAEHKPARKSKQLSTENSLTPDKHRKGSSSRSQNTKIVFDKNYKKLPIGNAIDNEIEINSPRSKNTEQNQDSATATINSKAKWKGAVSCPKSRLPDTLRRSDRRKNLFKSPPNAASSRPSMHEHKKLKNREIDDTNWDEGFIVDEDPVEIPRGKKMPLKRKSKQPPKRNRNKDDNTYSVKKGLPNTTRRAKKTGKPATLPVNQSPGTRAATATANEKTQGLANPNTECGDAQANLLTAHSKPTTSHNQQNALTDSAGTSSEAPIRIIADSLSQTLLATTDEATAADDLVQLARLAVSPRIEEDDKTRYSTKLGFVDDQVNLLQTKNQEDPPVVQPNAIANQDSNLRQEESNLSGTHLDPSLGRSNGRRKKTIEDSQPTEEEDISNIHSPILETKPTPLPPSAQEMPNVEPSAFDDPVNPDGTESGFFADATLFPTGNAENLKDSTENDLPEALRPAFRAENSQIPCTPQKASHMFDVKSGVDNAKVVGPMTIQSEVPIANKLESALASVGSRHTQQTASEAQLHNMHEASQNLQFDLEGKQEIPNQGVREIVPHHHKPEADSISAQNSTMTLSKIRAPEAQMTITKAKPDYSLRRDDEIRKGNQSPPSKQTRFLSEPEHFLEDGTLGSVYETESQPLEVADQHIKAMDSDDESESVMKNKHKPKTDRTVRLLFDAEDAHRNRKRGSDQTQQGPRKKGKTAKESKSHSALSTQKVRLGKTPEKVPLNINRKSNLISFSSNGPRNQGTIMGLQDRSQDILRSQRPQYSEAESNTGLKRKAEIVVRSCFGSSNEVSDEERAQDIIFAPCTLDVAPRMGQRCSSSIAKENSHKPSSQSMRVDMNGSPMPFVHSRQQKFRAHGTVSPIQVPSHWSTTEKMIVDGEDFTMLDDNPNDMEPYLPIMPSRFPHKLMTCELISSSSDKQGPSSPNQPSKMLGELAAHSVHPDGKLVNLQTETIVMPVRPPDPFLRVEQDEVCSNSFMDLLRKSVNVNTKGAGNKKESRAAVIKSTIDPNKTLVNDSSDKGIASRNMTPAGSSSSESSSSSSSSGSSSRSQSHLRELPYRVEEPSGETPWPKTLRPHQRDTLDILCEVSHRLVANLVDKETAIDDLVSDYKRGGMRIFDQFEKARQQDLDAFQARSIHLKRKLIALYKDEKAELEATAKAVKKRPVADIEKQWDAHQQALWAQMDNAIATCE